MGMKTQGTTPVIGDNPDTRPDFGTIAPVSLPKPTLSWVAQINAAIIGAPANQAALSQLLQFKRRIDLDICIQCYSTDDHADALFLIKGYRDQIRAAMGKGL